MKKKAKLRPMTPKVEPKRKPAETPTNKAIREAPENKAMQTLDDPAPAPEKERDEIPRP
jgi:hypothetical protein